MSARPFHFYSVWRVDACYEEDRDSVELTRAHDPRHAACRRAAWLFSDDDQTNGIQQFQVLQRGPDADPTVHTIRVRIDVQAVG